MNFVKIELKFRIAWVKLLSHLNLGNRESVTSLKPVFVHASPREIILLSITFEKSSKEACTSIEMHRH